MLFLALFAGVPLATGPAYANVLHRDVDKEWKKRLDYRQSVSGAVFSVGDSYSLWHGL